MFGLELSLCSFVGLEWQACVCFCVGACKFTCWIDSVYGCKCCPSLVYRNANTFKLDLNLSFKPAAAAGLWLAATLCMQHDSRLYVCVSLGQRATSCDRSGRHSRYDPGRSSMVHRRLSACLNTHAHTLTQTTDPRQWILARPHCLKAATPLTVLHTHIQCSHSHLTYYTHTDIHTFEHPLTLHTHKYISLMCQSFWHQVCGCRFWRRPQTLHTHCGLIWFYVNKHTLSVFKCTLVGLKQFVTLDLWSPYQCCFC